MKKRVSIKRSGIFLGGRTDSSKFRFVLVHGRANRKKFDGGAGSVGDGARKASWSDRLINFVGGHGYKRRTWGA